MQMRTAAAVLLWVACSSCATVELMEDRDAVMWNTQVGWFREWSSGKNGRYARVNNKADWADEPYEYVNLRLGSFMSSPGNVSLEVFDDELGYAAKRGRQVIFNIYIQLNNRNANDTKYMSGWLLSDPGMTYCKESNGVSSYFMIDFDNSEPILQAIEDVATKLGAAYNGDKRLFAISVGFVGFEGFWTQGLDNYQDNNITRKCPYPSDPTSARIIGAMSTAFSRTWVLMPNPWHLLTFDYTPYTNLGILIPRWPTTDTYLQDITEVGLQDRWQTAPVVALTISEYEKCWWDADPAVSCEMWGASSTPVNFEEELSKTHILTQYVPTTFLNYPSSDGAANVKMEAAYKKTGAMFHLNSVSLQVSGPSMRLCAQVSNIGSSPFYTLPHSPFKIWLSVNTDEYELTAATPLQGLLPGDTVAYAAEVPWLPVTDECLGNTVCSDVGQGCQDADTSPYSRGDWFCICMTGALGFQERARPAVCRIPTAYQYDEQRFYTDTPGDYQLIDQNATQLGLTNTSWSISMWLNLPRCSGTTDCMTSSLKSVWGDADTLMGFVEKEGKYKNLALVIESRRARSKFYSGDCNPSGSPYFPVNTWAHTLFVYDKDAETMWTYVDGVPVGNCTGVHPYIGEGRLAIGYRNETTKYSLDGWMKEFRIMNGIVDNVDIARLMATPPLYESPVPGRIRMDTDFRIRRVSFASKHSDLDSREMVVAIPGETAKSNEGCLLGGPTPVPTAVPVYTPNPPASTDGCESFVLLGFNATVLTANGEVGAACDGTYSWENDHWVKSDNTREVWRAPYDVYRCTLMGGAVDGPHLGHFDASWWGEHLICTSFKTPVPTPAPTPLPVGQTYPPDTDAPPTGTPSWAVTTGIPMSDAPTTMVPTAQPVASTGVPMPPPTGVPGVPMTPMPSPVPGVVPTAVPGTTMAPEGAETFSPALGTTKDEGGNGGLQWWFWFLLTVIVLFFVVSVAVWVKVWRRQKGESEQLARHKKQIAEGNGSRILDYPLIPPQEGSPMHDEVYMSDPPTKPSFGSPQAPPPPEDDTFVL